MPNKFEQPLMPPPEKPEAEEKKELFEQPASGEVREIKIKGKKREKAEEAAEKQPEKEPRISAMAEKKKSRSSEKAKKSEMAEISPEPEPEEGGRRPYSKEEWLEVAEGLKEQAAIRREKDKIEEREEIIELTEDMVVKEVEKPEKTVFNLCKQLREARRELAESEQDWKFRGGDYEKYRKNQKNKEDYNELQRQLLEHFLVKAEKRWGRDSEKFVEFKNRLIFKGFVGRERERFTKEKEDVLPEKEKGRFRKLFEKVAQNYAKIPKGVRWGIAAGLGTAVAFGTGGVAAPALLGYAGFRYGRAALGSLSAVGAKALGDAAEKIWLEKYGKEAREEKLKMAVEKETKNLSDWEMLSHYLAVQKDRRNEELAKLARRQKQWRVGKIAAMIGAGAGVSFWAGSIDAFTNETGVSRGVQEQLGIKEETPSIKVGPESFPPGIKAGSFIESAGPGDSVWKLAERQLESRGYFRDLSGTAEEIAAKKTYLADWIKDKVAENPEKFGLTDPDQLAIGQKIDFSEIFKDKTSILKAVGETEKLSPAEISHINYNNELISQWFKNHPGERLTTGKVAEILGGKRLEVLTEGEEVFSMENYLRGLAQEERELEEARILENWEDYQKLPGLSEEELRDIQDYYGRKISEYDGLGEREAAEAAEALKKFHAEELRIYNDITEILAPSNMRPAEYLAIKNVTIGKFLEETAGGWEKWRSDEAITINLPHDGVYGASEYGRQLKLADFIKNMNPTEIDKSLTIEEYLKQFVKK